MTDNESEISEAENLLSLKDFFESIPPSKWMVVESAIVQKDLGAGAAKDYFLQLPRLLLPCDSDICGGIRTFRSSSECRFYRNLKKDFFVEYVCANCTSTRKRYSILVARENEEPTNAKIYKYGEEPAFGPPTPTRLLRLFGDDQHLFLKGRRCESQALGVGAFAYYRRVVEKHKNQLLNEIQKVAKQVDAGAECIDALEKAKADTQFSSAVESIKSAIPQSLLIRGQNPLSLLHSALSIGLHDESDETCLELAHAVRVVLVELMERISIALKDEAELSDAVSRLMQAKNPQSKKRDRKAQSDPQS